jgi:hypothetical protein
MYQALEQLKHHCVQQISRLVVQFQHKTGHVSLQVLEQCQELLTLVQIIGHQSLSVGPMLYTDQ